MSRDNNSFQRKYQRQIPEPSLKDLFTDSFMNEYSKSSSITDLFAKGGFRVKSLPDISKIAKDELDAFIKKETSFFSWDDMLDAALRIYMNSLLGNSD
jgi:hypothetical protein